MATKHAFIQVIVLGDEDAVQTVSEPFINGLVINKTPGTTKENKLYNITHYRSGFAIMDYVPQECLTAVKYILNKEKWNIHSEKIAKSHPHRLLVEEAGTVIMAKRNRRSTAQEERLAKMFKGRTRPGSGNKWGYRRDVINDRVMMECKYTDSTSQRIEVEDLMYLRRQATSASKELVFSIEYGISTGLGHDIFLMELLTFFEDEASFRKEVFRHGTMATKVTVPSSQSGFSISRETGEAISSGKAVFIYEIPWEDSSSRKFIALDTEKTLNLLNQNRA